MTEPPVVLIAPDNLPSTARVLAEVAQERVRQDAKWGQQDHPDGTGPDGTLHGVKFSVWADQFRRTCQQAFADGAGTWLHVLAEEFAEAAAEGGPATLRAELIQVAAVAVAWTEAIDRRPKPASDPCPVCGKDGWPAGSAGNARRIHELAEHEGDPRVAPRSRQPKATR